MKKYLEEISSLQKKLIDDEDLKKSFEKSVEELHQCFYNGGRLLIAGNGGSAGQAQHLAAEFVGKFNILERKAYSAIALTTDTSILTAWSNDYSFNEVFSRQVEAHGRKGDIFLGITTSGNSENILKALRSAKKQGLKTITFLGKDGGKTKGMADIELIVQSSSTPRIQEIHLVLIHALTEEVERKLTESR